MFLVLFYLEKEGKTNLTSSVIFKYNSITKKTLSDILCCNY